MTDFKVGDRVFYVTNGPSDTGTIIRIDLDGFYGVNWDKDPDTDAYDSDQLRHVTE